MPGISKSDFAEQIRQALQNLHDFAVLQKLPITSLLNAPSGTLDQGVRKLRSEILDAIEQLNPTGNMPSRAKERRPYALLYGHYVQGMTTAELAEELAISIRQLRREHARAVEAVLDLLWERLVGQLETKTGEDGMSLETTLDDATERETEQLISQGHVDDIALIDLVNGIYSTLAPVAAGRKIKLLNRLSGNLPLVRANRVVLRQGLLGVISSALQHLSAGEISVKSADTADFRLWIIAHGDFQAAESTKIGLDVSRKLIASLGGQVEIEDGHDQWKAEITLPMAEKLPILLMDDNAGLIELYRRYLAGRGYRVLEAHSAEEAISIAQKYSLKLVILDVMMPEQDGWEVLQRLRSAEPTKTVPVLICSVLDETEIAYTLGASDYLHKPVTQDALLVKVERWSRVPSLPGGLPIESPVNKPASRKV